MIPFLKSRRETTMAEPKLRAEDLVKGCVVKLYVGIKAKGSSSADVGYKEKNRAIKYNL